MLSTSHTLTYPLTHHSVFPRPALTFLDFHQHHPLTSRTCEMKFVGGVDGTKRFPKVRAGRGISPMTDRKSTRLNSSHVATSYAVFCLTKKSITKSTSSEVM